MKNRIFSLFFVLFLFASIGQAQEIVRYLPDWKIGDTVRYGSKIDISFYSPAYPLAPLLKDRPIIVNTITRYEVIGKDEKSTEFQLSFESIEFESDFLELILPGWKQEFSKRMGFDFEEIKKLIYTKGIFCYRIDSKGNLIEITHVENYIDFYNTLSKLTKEKLPPITESNREQKIAELKRAFSTLSVNSASKPFNLPPHPSYFMGKDFTLGEDQKDVFSTTIPPTPNFLEKSVDLSLPGTMDVTQSNEVVQINSHFTYTEQTIYQWGNAIIPNLVDDLKQEIRTFDKKELSDFWKKLQKSNSILLKSDLSLFVQFNPYKKFTDQFNYNEVIRGEFYPNRFPDRHTITADPVPFEIKISSASKRLPEGNSRKENN